MRVLMVISLVLASVELLAALVLEDLDLRVIDATREYDGRVIGKLKQSRSENGTPTGIVEDRHKDENEGTNIHDGLNNPKALGAATGTGTEIELGLGRA